MQTIGVDLSAKDDKTWMATIEWVDGAAHARLSRGVGDGAIVEATRRAAKVGVDCPLGWPSFFVEFVRAHEESNVELQEPPGEDWRRRLANRETDLWVREQVGLTPLSVSADRIGHVAFRCAHLLAVLKKAAVHVDRSGGTGAVVEVYPAASLRRWGYLNKGYKGRDGRQALRSIATQLLTDAAWLTLSDEDRTLCLTNDDAFDALVAGFSARAQAMGLVTALSNRQRHIGTVEGWIALPTSDSFARLAHG